MEDTTGSPSAQYDAYIDPSIEKRASEGETLQAVMQLAQAASQQHLSQRHDNGGEGKRALSSSKRAAQNRAAQRAFRERRDRYVKELEAKAAQLESALRQAEESRSRYADALTTIDGLRQDNHSLRVALAALGGHVAGPPPQSVREEQSLEGLSAVAVAAAQEQKPNPEKPS